MAFGWDDLAMLAVTAYGSMASGDAAKKQGQGGKNALAEQQRQYNIALAMLEPQRGLGYGAQQDIASLYGYRLPGYTPLNALGGSTGNTAGGSSNWAVGSPVNVGGKKASDGLMDKANAFGGSGGGRRFGATIDPVTGTVNVNAKRHEDRRSEMATNYLRGNTDELKGGKFKRIRKGIDAMREQGYQWTPGTPEPTAGVMDGRESQNAMLDRFQQMPGYQFGMREGTNALQQSAANRGGLFSGDTGKDLMSWGQDYAGTKFGEEFNRLMAMAGMGQTATNSAVNVGQNYANNAGNAYQNIADSRASGVMGQANTIGNGLNSWLNYRLLNRNLGGNGYQVPDDIRDFQYPFGG